MRENTRRNDTDNRGTPILRILRYVGTSTFLVSLSIPVPQDQIIDSNITVQYYKLKESEINNIQLPIIKINQRNAATIYISNFWICPHITRQNDQRVGVEETFERYQKKALQNFSSIR